MEIIVPFYGTRNNNGQPMKDFIPYAEARQWVSRLGLENYRQWLRFSKMRYQKGTMKGKLIRPRFIPANPQCAYGLRQQWISDNDFLGHKQYTAVDEAKYFAHTLKFDTRHQWREWHRQYSPDHIPRYPEFVYTDWVSWPDFLGSDKYARKNWIPYDQAIQIVHQFKLENRDEYAQWNKDHPQIIMPPSPDVVYNKQWEGWGKFLGKTAVERIEVYQSVDTEVLYIAHRPGDPSNVYEIAVDRVGKANVDLRRHNMGYQIIKVYKTEEDRNQAMKHIIQANGTQWYEERNVYSVFNLYELLFQLDVLLFSV